VSFEFFNEPYFGNQNAVLSLTCLAGTHGNPAWKATNGGSPITVTNGQTPPVAPGASSLGATLTGEHFVMLYGGTCSAFYQQSVYVNSRGIPPGFVNSGNPGLSGVLNKSWRVYGYQEALDGLRALGAPNACLVNGSGFASVQSVLPYYMPVDSLSPPQIGTGVHMYQSGTSSYPASLDPGSGTATCLTYPVANANGTGGLGYAVPVMVTEIGTASGVSLPQPDPFIERIITLTKAQPVGSFHFFEFTGNYTAPYGSVGPDNYSGSIYGAPINITGGISGATLTVTAASGVLKAGMAITNGAQLGSPYLLPYGSGGTTGTGGLGTYEIDNAQSVALGTAMQMSAVLPWRGQSQTVYNWA
jgi:hypothetical protein